MLQKEFTPPPVERTGRSEILTYNAPPIKPPEGRTSDWTTPSESSRVASVAVQRVHRRHGAVDSVPRPNATMGAGRVGSAGSRRHHPRRPARSRRLGMGRSSPRRLQRAEELERVRRRTATHTTAADSTSTPPTPPTQSTSGSQPTSSLNFSITPTRGRSPLSRDDAEDLAAEHRREERVATIRDVEEIATSEFWQQYTTGAASVKRLTKSDLTDHDLKALCRALPRYDDVVEDTHHVRVLTIHASKGSRGHGRLLLRWNHRKIAREMDRSEETRQNEARTWYVGLSRASERLHLMYDAFLDPSIIYRGISRRRQRRPLDCRRAKR